MCRVLKAIQVQMAFVEIMVSQEKMGFMDLKETVVTQAILAQEGHQEVV